jgi:hypothetical protein
VCAVEYGKGVMSIHNERMGHENTAAAVIILKFFMTGTS